MLFDAGGSLGGISIVPWESMKANQPVVRVSKNTCDDSALQFLVSKLQECQKNHGKCQHDGEPWMPNRVLNVGMKEGDRIRLVSREDISHAPYFTLSHCWGGSLPPEAKLSQETAQSLREGIFIDTLPKTFRDAIFVARKFGISYLWIDTLCIFQDNINDWGVEAALMRDVYSRAICCIAATSSKNSFGGLFFDRDPKNPVRVEACRPGRGPDPALYWCDSLNMYQNSIENAPLNKRAWVAQERFLSPRIMHFTEEVLFWECHELCTNEIYFSGLPSYSIYSKNVTAGLKQALILYRKSMEPGYVPGPLHYALHDFKFQQPSPRELVYETWGAFVRYYASLHMTKKDDKFVALAGIAKDIAETMNDTLLAGMWSSRIITELCWVKLSACDWKQRLQSRDEEWVAPTWSWASFKGLFHLSEPFIGQENCKVYKTFFETLHLEVVTGTSGELTRTELSLQCDPMLGNISIVDNKGTSRSFEFTPMTPTSRNVLSSSVEGRYSPTSGPLTRAKLSLQCRPMLGTIRTINSAKTKYKVEFAQLATESTDEPSPSLAGGYVFHFDYMVTILPPIHEIYLVLLHGYWDAEGTCIGIEALILEPHESLANTFYRIGLYRLPGYDDEFPDIETVLARHQLAEPRLIHIL